MTTCEKLDKWVEKQQQNSFIISKQYFGFQSSIYYYIGFDMPRNCVNRIQELQQIKNTCFQIETFSNWMAKEMISKLAQILAQHFSQAVSCHITGKNDEKFDIRGNQKQILEHQLEQIKDFEDFCKTENEKYETFEYQNLNKNEIGEIQFFQQFPQKLIKSQQITDTQKQIEKIEKQIKEINFCLRDLVSKLESKSQKNTEYLQRNQSPKLQVKEIHEILNEIEKQIKVDSFSLPYFRDSQIYRADNAQNQENNVGEVRAVDWIDPYCYNYNRLSIHNDLVISNSPNWQRAVGKIPFILKFKTLFKVKVEKIKEFLGLGVVDSALKTKAYLNGQQNRICYYNDGQCWMGKEERKHQGVGFKEGQAVQINVNLELGIIEWKVNSQIRHIQQCSKLRDKTIMWVPYIRFKNEGDCIRIIQ